MTPSLPHIFCKTIEGVTFPISNRKESGASPFTLSPGDQFIPTPTDAHDLSALCQKIEDIEATPDKNDDAHLYLEFGMASKQIERWFQSPQPLGTGISPLVFFKGASQFAPTLWSPFLLVANESKGKSPQNTKLIRDSLHQGERNIKNSPENFLFFHLEGAKILFEEAILIHSPGKQQKQCIQEGFRFLKIALSQPTLSPEGTEKALELITHLFISLPKNNFIPLLEPISKIPAFPWEVFFISLMDKIRRDSQLLYDMEYVRNLLVAALSLTDHFASSLSPEKAVVVKAQIKAEIGGVSSNDEASQCFHEAIGLLKQLIDQKGGMENTPPAALIEYASSLQELAEYKTDTNAVQFKKEIEELFSEAQRVLLYLHEHFPAQPFVEQKWVWYHYYKAKFRLNQIIKPKPSDTFFSPLDTAFALMDYNRSLTEASRAHQEAAQVAYQTYSTYKDQLSPQEKTSILRAYIWAVNEGLYLALMRDNLPFTSKTSPMAITEEFSKNSDQPFMEMALSEARKETIEEGGRPFRDIILAKIRYNYVQARLLSEDYVERTYRTYLVYGKITPPPPPDESKIVRANALLDENIQDLKNMVDRKLETRPWLPPHAQGWAKLRQPHQDLESLFYFLEAIIYLPSHNKFMLQDTKKGIKMAILIAYYERESALINFIRQISHMPAWKEKWCALKPILMELGDEMKNNPSAFEDYKNKILSFTEDGSSSPCK